MKAYFKGSLQMIDSTLEKIEGKLIESIKVNGLADLAQEYAELGLDMVLEEGALRDIPIVGTIVNAYKTVASMRDRIYLNKLVHFLKKVGETTQEQRRKFVEDNCKDTRQFEEAVLLILEQADNINKISLIGKVFKACILEMINYKNALTISSMVNRAFWRDVEGLISNKYDSGSKMRLYTCGLMNLDWRRKTYQDLSRNMIQDVKFDGFCYKENEYTNLLRRINNI